MPLDRAVHVITWNASGKGTSTLGGVAKPREGVYVVTLAPMALSALTTIDTKAVRNTSP